MFTDVSEAFLNAARPRFAQYPFIDFKTLDAERDMMKQGWSLRSTDLVCAANVIHATRDLRNTLTRVRRLLVHGGVLILYELTSPSHYMDATVGLTSGWWEFDDYELRPEYALLSPARWGSFLAELGFETPQIFTPEMGSDAAQRQALLQEAESLPSLLLNSAAAANAVMLGAGYFNPLTGYMNLADALSVSASLHTTKGLFWPIPVINLTKDISAISGASRIALRDPNTEGHPVIALMDVAAIEEVSAEQIQSMAADIFGTQDPEHPGVATFNNLGNQLISGDIHVLN